jgi:hypothetical protein
MKILNTNDDVVNHFDKITKEFKGQINELESAIGFYMVARQFGWKPLILIHDKNTVKKYEQILKINFRDELPAEGQYAEKSVAYVAVLKVKSFWKAVKGEIPNIKTREII